MLNHSEIITDCLRQTTLILITRWASLSCIFSFQNILEEAIELCRFPPMPDAICRHEKCHGHLKAEIYFTDPDFKVNDTYETQPG